MLNLARYILMFVAGFISAGAPLCFAGDGGIFSISGKDATQLVAQALATSDSSLADTQVHIQGINDSDTLVSSDNTVTTTLSNVQIDKAHTHWEAVLQPQSDGHEFTPIHLAGRYEELRAFPTLTHTMSPGETVSKDDIEWSKLPVSRVHSNVILDAENLIGKSPRHALSAHRAIRQDEVAGVTVVSKGTRVAMVFKAGNLSIRTIGEAMDNGAMGEVVRVRNLESKTIVQGVVEATGRVRVGSPDANTAELP